MNPTATEHPGVVSVGVDPDWAEVEAAGLLADAPDLDDRRALISLLAAGGLTVTEMADAHQAGGLVRAGGDGRIRPDAGRFTLAEVAERLGADTDVVRRAWRSLGAVDPGADVRVASTDDVELMDTALHLVDLLGERSGWPLLRRYGAVVERFTEATSSALITELPDLSIARSGSEVVTARLWNQVAELVPRIGRLMDLTMRHHVESVRRHFELSTAGVERGQTALVLGVGFADLSGYTAASLLHDLRDVGAIVADFEGRAAEVVSRLGGRIVKFVGDAVLFVSVDPDALAEMALAIVEPLQTEGTRLTARAGLSHGTVLARDGDYFGPAVNLAARLVGIAPQGAVVASEDLVEALDGARWALQARPPEDLRGIGAPVTPYLLAAAAP